MKRESVTRAIRGVPEWIQGNAEVWGHEIRKFVKRAGNVQGTCGRIAEEGVGAAIRSFNNEPPNVGFNDLETTKFNRAYLDLDTQPRHVLWVHFVEYGTARDKFEFVGVKRQKYYEILRDTLCKMAAEFHLYD
jgi:hypothetical protein